MGEEHVTLRRRQPAPDVGRPGEGNVEKRPFDRDLRVGVAGRSHDEEPRVLCPGIVGCRGNDRDPRPPLEEPEVDIDSSSLELFEEVPRRSRDIDCNLSPHIPLSFRTAEGIHFENLEEPVQDRLLPRVSTGKPDRVALEKLHHEAPRVVGIKDSVARDEDIFPSQDVPPRGPVNLLPWGERPRENERPRVDCTAHGGLLVTGAVQGFTVVSPKIPFYCSHHC